MELRIDSRAWLSVTSLVLKTLGLLTLLLMEEGQEKKTAQR